MYQHDGSALLTRELPELNIALPSSGMCCINVAGQDYDPGKWLDRASRILITPCIVADA